MYNKSRILLKSISAHGAAINRLKFLSNEFLMASCSSDNLVKIWNTKNWTLVRTYSGHADNVNDLEFISSYKAITGSNDHKINVWSLVNGSTLLSLDAGAWVLSLNLLPNNLLASGLSGSSGNLKIWNFTSGELVYNLVGHTNQVNHLALVSASSNVLASASSDNSIIIWQYVAQTQMLKLNGHTDWVNVLKVISNELIASGSNDHSIKVWNLTSGNLVRTLSGHTNAVFGLDLMNNSELISVSYDSFVKSWRVSPGSTDDGQLLSSIDTAYFFHALAIFVNTGINIL